MIGAYTGGLIAGFTLGIFISALILSLKPERFSSNEIKTSINLARIKELASRYKKYPLFSTWDMLLLLLSNEIVIFMLSFFFNPAIVGFYSLGKRLLEQPVRLISLSVQNVYFQKAAKDYANHLNIKGSFKKTTLMLALIGIPPFLFLGLYGKPLFIFIFGKEWATAGQFVQIMSPWFFLIFITSPAHVIYEVCQKQNIKLILNIIMAVFKFSALFAGYKLSHEPYLPLILFVSVAIILLIVLLLVAMYIANKNDIKFKTDRLEV